MRVKLKTFNHTYLVSLKESRLEDVSLLGLGPFDILPIAKARGF